MYDKELEEKNQLEKKHHLDEMAIQKRMEEERKARELEELRRQEQRFLEERIVRENARREYEYHVREERRAREELHWRERAERLYPSWGRNLFTISEENQPPSYYHYNSDRLGIKTHL